MSAAAVVNPTMTGIDTKSTRKPEKDASLVILIVSSSHGELLILTQVQHPEDEYRDATEERT